MREPTNLEKRIQSLYNQVFDLESHEKLDKLNRVIKKYNGLIELITVVSTHTKLYHYHYTPDRFWDINSEVLSEAISHIDPIVTIDESSVGLSWYILHGFHDGEHIGFLDASLKEYTAFLSKMPEPSYKR